MQKRVLFICQYFYPEVFRGNDIAFDMAQKGHEVTVICGIPNYPKGRFFDSYGIFKRNREYIKGVRVIRLPIIPRGNGRALMLFLNYFSYFVIASLYLPFHLLFNKKYDKCFVQQLSPVIMSFPGVIFKKLTKRPLYTWVLDLWPESLKAAGGVNNKYILYFFERFAKSEYKNSDVILVSSMGFANNISAKGDFAHKIHFMPNWAEDELQYNEKLEIPTMPNCFKALFAGNVGEAQDFECIVEAAKLLNIDDDICFIIVGDGRKKDWIEDQVEKFNLHDKIILFGRYDLKYMPSFFNKADCLFLSLKDNEILNLTVPAKLQAYMSNGKPIVGMLNGEANMMIKEINCGFSVPASSPDLLVDALRKLKNMHPDDRNKMGLHGKKYCHEYFDKRKILDNLYSLMHL